MNDWLYLLGVAAGAALIVFREPIARTVADSEENLLSMMQKRAPEHRERKYQLGKQWAVLLGCTLALLCLLRFFQGTQGL